MTDAFQVPPPTPEEMPLVEIASQCLLDSQRWWPNRHNYDLGFLALCLSGEVGEVDNIVKKIWRGSFTLKEAKADLEEEIVDAFTYMMNIVGVLNMDLLEGYLKKRAFNEERWGPRARAAEQRMKEGLESNDGT